MPRFLQTRMAFVTDPDGYEVELQEEKQPGGRDCAGGLPARLHVT
jgi:hypothetical protein